MVDLRSLQKRVQLVYYSAIILLLILLFIFWNFIILIAFIFVGVYFGWIVAFLVIINKLRIKRTTIQIKQDYIAINFVSALSIFIGSLWVFRARERIFVISLNNIENISRLLLNFMFLSFLFGGLIFVLILIRSFYKSPIEQNGTKTVEKVLLSQGYPPMNLEISKNKPR